MTGKIRQLSERGFGFLQPVGDASREAGHFFHAKHVVDLCFEALKIGDELEFDSHRGEKGLEARNVRQAE